MSRILFSHSYFLRFDPKQWKQMQPYPPLATIQAAAVLRQHHHEVSLFDTMFVESADGVVEAIDEFKPQYFVIYDDGFNYLTKMCLTNMREAAFEMAAYAKQAGCTVIVSSSDSTDHCAEYLNRGADFIMIGEAEQTLLALIDNTGSAMNIPGLAYLKNGEVVKTAARQLMKHLDELPLPAWDLIDMESYRSRWLSKWGYFSLNMATTRGCPYKCNWCAKPIYGNNYNMRSPAHVVNELKMLKEKFGVNHIWFCDDIFGLKRNWVIEFAQLVKEAKLKFSYKIQSRADLLVQEKYVEALAASGCESVWMGAESGSQKILDAMDKGITIAEIKEACALLKQHHIKPAFFLQFGYPGETKQDIQQTIQLLNECMPDDIGISVSYPLPGTKFYERVKEELKNKTNWTDSDELALMFRNTFQPAFYKNLHKYVHRNYRKLQGFAAWQKLFTQPGSLNLTGLRRAVLLPYYSSTAFFEKRKLEKAWK